MEQQRERFNPSSLRKLLFFSFFQGNWRNLKQVVTWTCLPYGNGIEWTLREGAGKYDLTVSG
jgi:hypothetical protein